MRVNWTTSLTLAAAIATFGCNGTTTPDAGPEKTGPEPICIATGDACAAEAPCCTGSCIDSFSDAGMVCGVTPAFWVDGGAAGVVVQPKICGSSGSGDGSSEPACPCTGDSDCASASCSGIGSVCCGIPGSKLYDSPDGCACGADSDCVSTSCSGGVCTAGEANGTTGGTGGGSTGGTTG